MLKRDEVADSGGEQILLWINHFAVAPRDGGGTRHFEMSRELVDRGWKVVVAAADFHLQARRYTRRPGPKVRDTISEQLEGVEFNWHWSAPYEKNDWRRGWNWLSFAQSILRSERDPKPDVVIGSSPHLFAAAAGSLLARRFRVPFVLEVRDLWPESIVAAGGRKGVLYHIFAGLAKYLYHRADLIICLARGTQRHLEGEGLNRGKLVYIPNGVDPDAFENIDRSANVGFTLVYAGAHGPANGLDVVLDAAELLRDRTEIRFLLVGDGPAKKGLKEAAGARGLTNVQLRDPVSKEQMPEIFAEADAGLMVLRDTPLFAFGVSPNKLFDYFGASMPVVCNVPGEVAAMVEAAGGGEQANPGSAKSLADAVVRLYERSADERAAMGRSAREWVVKEHGRPVLAQRLDHALREVLGT